MYVPLVALSFVVVFFFQAEDGIRDYKVTGVQTCALPIYNIGCQRRLYTDVAVSDSLILPTQLSTSIVRVLQKLNYETIVPVLSYYPLLKEACCVSQYFNFAGHCR